MGITEEVFQKFQQYIAYRSLANMGGEYSFGYIGKIPLSNVEILEKNKSKKYIEPKVYVDNPAFGTTPNATPKMAADGTTDADYDEVTAGITDYVPGKTRKTKKT